MSTGMIDTVKETSVNAFKSTQPVGIYFGKVTSANPPKVSLATGDKTFELTKEFLIVKGTLTTGDDVTLIRVQGGQRYVVIGGRIVHTTNTVYVGGGITGDGSVIDKAVSWALSIANDNSHGYDQGSRWGPDYDCSSFVISAFEAAGLPLKANGANATGSMYAPFKKCGFVDVTNQITMSNGSGLQRGDVVLKPQRADGGGGHTALVVEPGTLVHARINENNKATGGKKGDQTEKEICCTNYYNKPWTYVLRYTGS